MLKALRKYNKWFMVGFGVLLMMAWLVAPVTQRVSSARLNRVIAKLDGQGITAKDHMTATREISALDAFEPGITRGFLGMADKDTVHWLLLTREADAAGLVGGIADGRAFMEQIVRGGVEQQMNRDFQFIFSMQGKSQEEMVKARDEYLQRGTALIMARLAGQGLTEDELDMMFARLRGVERLISSYRRAARVSDRQAALTAKEYRDGAFVDAVFVPASLTADTIPDPDPAALQAHFDAFKATKPGEGDYGIGYLLPRRVKLEWMTLDRKAIEDAVKLDPVEVRKRYSSTRTRYPGEFAAERANVERDMKTEAADRVMQEAQTVIQAEVLKSTRRLEPDGQYKKLPPDWQRPQYEAVAQAVVEALKKNGMEIPLPSVLSQTGKWLTESDLEALPGIGRATQRSGGISAGFAQVIAATRELGGEAVAFPVQVGIPLVEHFLTDALGNRYYVTVLATRGESAPDSVDEIKEQAVKDYKTLRAFEALKARESELRQIAVAGGLDAVAAAVAPPPPANPDPANPAPKAPEVRKSLQITKTSSGGEPNLDDESVRTAILTAAAAIDPLTPWGQVDPEKGTVVAPSAKRLGVAVVRILARSPLSIEEYRTGDAQVVAFVQQKELEVTPGSENDPFSLANLLKRHEYTSGDQRIRTTDDLRRGEQAEG